MDSYPGSLAQVLTNLVLNSMQHAFDPAAPGVIVIAAKAVGDDEVEIRYQDDGRGIPQELHDKIFQPFFTTRRGSGGSGLGLHLVYNIVTHRLNGTITVENGQPRGTTFTLHIARVSKPGALVVNALRALPGSTAHG